MKTSRSDRLNRLNRPRPHLLDQPWQTPEQTLLVDPSEKPSHHWCWIVLWRMWINGFELTPDAASRWTDWALVPKPDHFRSETGAGVRRDFLIDKTKIIGHKKEFKVEPKYLGYIPGEDEAWISP